MLLLIAYCIFAWLILLGTKYENNEISWFVIILGPIFLPFCLGILLQRKIDK